MADSVRKLHAYVKFMKRRRRRPSCRSASQSASFFDLRPTTTVCTADGDGDDDDYGTADE